MKNLILIFTFIFVLESPLLANEEGHHEGSEAEHKHGEEEESSAIGPEKGILEKTVNGMKLSPEAIKTFDLRTINYSTASKGFPKNAAVHVKDEVSIFRLRDGWYKRVSAEAKPTANGKYIVSSTKLKAGDKVVIEGAGFLRMAEVAAEGGMSEGHSH